MCSLFHSLALVTYCIFKKKWSWGMNAGDTWSRLGPIKPTSLICDILVGYIKYLYFLVSQVVFGQPSQHEFLGNLSL